MSEGVAISHARSEAIARQVFEEILAGSRDRWAMTLIAPHDVVRLPTERLIGPDRRVTLRVLNRKRPDRGALAGGLLIRFDPTAISLEYQLRRSR
ncbi:MAG: hypothetical protein QOF01_3908 [Thermomicrobiales bacterium]|jgi:hypothetical protein|nr:hypothetical protein [Thermomicrobiales bacterium]